jgi:DNA repair exonuclease SbcCD ATPase subunit
VIRIESVHVEETRGIRKLDLSLGQKTFAISGPNGSGKSGVIDAIEFGLTGQIGRLTGRGTQGLTVSEHGPHVDKAKFPDAAFVTLTVFLPGIDKTATITRKIATPGKPTIEPDDADIKAVLAEVADHPEITLSRREILRFILVEPTKRSEEIQTILKLEEIGQTRAVLNTAQNKLGTAFKTATAQVESARSALMLHLQIATLKAEDLLQAVNKRRTLLGLLTIPELTPDTKLDAGLSAAAKPSDFNRESALRDLKAFADAGKGFGELGKAEAAAITAALKQLDADPALLAALQRRSFIERGLELVDGSACPLCDTPWQSDQDLREHLKDKLAKSEEARKLQEELLENAGALAAHAVRSAGLIAPVQKLSDSQKDAAFAQLLSAWKVDLDAFRAKLASVEGIRERQARFAGAWLAVPKAFEKGLKGLTEKVEAQPDQTATLDAQTFLTTAQTRLSDYREAMRRNKAAEIAVNAARQAYETYCGVLEEELNALYNEVEKWA